MATCCAAGCTWRSARPPRPSRNSGRCSRPSGGWRPCATSSRWRISRPAAHSRRRRSWANNLAWILSEHGGDKDKALALAQTAKEAAREDPQVSDTLGWIFYRRGVHQRALALLKDSAAKLPGNPQIHSHLGMVSAQLGDREAARQALSIAAASPTPFPGQDEVKKALAALK